MLEPCQAPHLLALPHGSAERPDHTHLWLEWHFFVNALQLFFHYLFTNRLLCLPRHCEDFTLEKLKQNAAGVVCYDCSGGRSRPSP